MPRVRAAVKVAASRSELWEFDLPPIAPDAGLLRVEAAGVCGSDVGSYPTGLRRGPHIMGHENVGEIVGLGEVAARRWGLREGDRVLLEEYLPCGQCDWCRSGDFRLCEQTEIHANPDALRYGSTPVSIPPALWGGFSEFLYLHPDSVFHRLPAGLPAEQAALGLPLGNGWQWAYFEAGAGPGRTILVMGPGQQGLGCVIAAREAGADQVLVSGLARDRRRLEVARSLGADVTIDVEREDLRERVLEVTRGRGVDAVVDAAAASERTILPAIDVVRKGGTLILAAGRRDQVVDAFPSGRVKTKYLRVRGVRGHSYQAVELALRTLGAGRYPVEDLCSHRFELADVHAAIGAAGGAGATEAIHVTVVPASR